MEELSEEEGVIENWILLAKIGAGVGSAKNALIEDEYTSKTMTKVFGDQMDSVIKSVHEETKEKIVNSFKVALEEKKQKYISKTLHDPPPGLKLQCQFIWKKPIKKCGEKCVQEAEYPIDNPLYCKPHKWMH